MEIEKTIENFSMIYGWLSDEQSREIYINRLNFLISGDYKYMHNIIQKYVPDMAALNDKAIPELLERLLEDGECSIVISTHRGLYEIREYLIRNRVAADRIYEMTPYMFAMQEEQYFNTDFMSFDEEVFVDAGCCDLSTAVELSRHCNKLKKVYAFEPDPENYKVCLENMKNFGDNVVEMFPKGTWSRSGKLFFSATCDGSSHVSESGETSIDVITVDEAVNRKEKVTFIKMDMEGSELESLKGAEKTIINDKPKLAICIYHKPEDMITLPLYIKKLVPEYKLYLRHHSNGAGETVLYAIAEQQSF